MGLTVEQIFFIKLELMELSGVSPDGIRLQLNHYGRGPMKREFAKI